jgi:glycosyltransferase involved in cell wall biosynthesis
MFPRYVMDVGASTLCMSLAIGKLEPVITVVMGRLNCFVYNSLSSSQIVITWAIWPIYCSIFFFRSLSLVLLQTLEEVKTVRLCGFVSGKEFDQVLHNADFLLHTESFKEDYIELVRNSVSTKIADSLGSGVPLIAYGPDCIASMGHLIRNDCAIAITEKDALKETLLRAFSEKAFREQKARNGLSVATRYHEPQACGELVRNVIERIIAQ